MGKRVGNYVLGRKVGSGNYSIVRTCVDSETGETWAMKIIDKEQLLKEQLYEQMKREIVILKALRHPNVVLLKEVMQTTSHVYLVLELMTGGELYAQLSQAQRFSEAVARKYFQQLIVGLHHCHANGVAHRDLKLENLLLDSNGVLKINDFGLSNFQPAEKAVLRTVCGTPNYVAPEVLQDRGYDGKIADIWSCGVILYAMVAGRLPFHEDNLPQLYAKIDRGDYRVPRSFTPELKDLVCRLLTVKPTDRITIPQIAAHPWFSIGFDPNLLQTAAISVTDEALTNAIRQMEQSSRPNESEPPSPSSRAGGGKDAVLPINPALEQHITGKGPADAFDLISRLTAGRLNPLVADNRSGVTIVKTLNQFVYRGTKEQLLQVLQQNMQCNPKETVGAQGSSNLIEIKCFISLPHGTVTFKVIMIGTAAKSLFLVEAKRGRGDAFDFYRIFAQLVEYLGPAVRSRSTVAAAPTPLEISPELNPDSGTVSPSAMTPPHTRSPKHLPDSFLPPIPPARKK